MDKTSLVAKINATPAAQIAELDFVRDRFIKNYNLSHKSALGDLMYHRQLVFFNQQISGNTSLSGADKFSLYACFVTAAVNGYSFDPEDNEVYLIAYKGKAALNRQAGAHVRRLIRTGQIKFVEQAKIVYKGDIFEVENGRVIRHVEKFETEEVVAGYARFILDDNGTDRFFIYRKSDFDSWRKKSPNPKTIQKQGQGGSTYLSEALWDNGVINGTTPEPGFLRTKIIKHACKEKCWATGSTPVEIEQFSVEVDVDADETPEVLENSEDYTHFEEVKTTTAAEPVPVAVGSHTDDDTF